MDYKPILFFILIVPIVFSLSQLGGNCQFSRDCAQGYCENNICKIPSVLEKYYTSGECNATIDCTNGFCYSGECIVIPSESYNVVPLGTGLQSSCAGFIENCTGITCLFCNVTWIILLIAAGASAFIARKKGRLVPIILFAIPILLGIAIFPFAGAIFAIFELVMLAFLKQSAVKSAMQDLLSIFKKPQQQIKETEKEEGKKEEKKEEGMEQLPFD
jgi:hypothetical protein